MPKHITIGLFETFETLGQTLTIILEDLLEQYGLTKSIPSYVKKKGANLNIMIVALKLVVSCEALGVLESFYGTCFGHALKLVGSCEALGVLESFYRTCFGHAW
jgi:hypothetical protein